MTTPATLPAFTIRETRPADLEEILRHRRMMFYDMGYQNSDALDLMVKRSRPNIERYLADGSYRGWFALAADARVVAGVGLIITELVSGPLSPEQTCRPYLLNVYTDPEFRHRGLARQLTVKAIEWCRTQGFKVVWLHASKYGRPLYESLGFEQTNEMKLML